MLRRAGPRTLSLAPLAAAAFFIVSGGPYGLEEVLQAHGYRRGLALLLILPVMWSLPVALLVGELGSALPRTGGYYEWVRRGLGSFWGLQEAWLSLAYTVVDLAIYPTLLATYLTQLWPSLGGVARGSAGWWLGVALVAGGVVWNALGIRAVGLGSEWMAVVILGPFAVLVALAALALPGGGWARLAAAVSGPTAAPAGGATFAAGLLLALWNYLGWDNASTFAGEVEDAQRAYPRAMFATVALVTVAYVLPVLAAASAGIPAASFSAGSWVGAARALGGPALGVAVALGGAVSVVGMFNAIVLSWSRLPVALAEDGALPRWLARRSPRSGAPVPALVAGGVLVVGCVGLGLDRLIAIDVMLYGPALVLEFIALFALRLREPELPRPFRVPGGAAVAAVLGLGPTVLLVLTFWRARDEPGALGLGALSLTGLVSVVGPLWWLALRARDRLRASPVSRRGAR